MERQRLEFGVAASWFLSTDASSTSLLIKILFDKIYIIIYTFPYYYYYYYFLFATDNVGINLKLLNLFRLDFIIFLTVAGFIL